MNELPDSFFKKLSPKQEREFRQWARENYNHGETIPCIWHPVVRDECEKINKEHNL